MLGEELYSVKSKRSRRVYWYRIADDVQVCGARIRQHTDGGDHRCTRRIDHLEVSGRCRQHGGVSAYGINSGLYTGSTAVPSAMTNMRAKRLGEILGERFDQAYQADDLMDLRRPVAALGVISERQAERMQALDTPEFRKSSLDLYEAAAAAQGAALAATERGDTAAAAEHAHTAQQALAGLGTLLRRGASYDQSEKKYADTLGKQSTQIENAWKVALSAASVVSTAEFDGAVRQILDIICNETSGLPDRQAAIVQRIDREVFFGQLLDPIRNTKAKTVEANGSPKKGK